MTPIRDVDALRTAITSCSSLTDRRHIIREAKRLGRCDILPRAWTAMRSPRDTTSADIEQTLAVKADASGIALAKLRCVYMRGVQEFDALTACVLPRDAWAQARVNSFIRLAAGSRLVRKDDADLLAH